MQIRRAGEELATRNLDTNLQEFKKFHATRKFRAAAKAVMAIRRMSRTSFTSNDNSPVDKENAERAAAAATSELTGGD